MFSDTEISALAASASAWELAGYFAAFMVAAACCGEYVHELKDAPVLAGSWWKRNGGKFSAKVLIIALVVELMTQVKTANINGQIISRLNVRAQVANKAAEEANERAKASEVNLEALQRNQAPRLMRLLNSNFGELLEGKPIGVATIWYAPDNDDAYVFAKWLAGYLSIAGWVTFEPVKIPFPPGGINDATVFLRATGGVSTGGESRTVLRYSPQSMTPDKETPIGVLAKALSDVGLSAAGKPDPNCPKDDVLIVVGAK